MLQRKNKQIKRDHKIKEAQSLGKELVLKHFPCPENAISEGDFLVRWKKLYSDLERLSKSLAELQYAHNSAVYQIKQYQITYNWRFSPPTYLCSDKEKAPLMTEKWMWRIQRVTSVYENWMIQLNHENYLDDPANWFQSVILSLIFHSGQCTEDVIVEFSKTLQRNNVNMYKLNNLSFCTLILDSKFRPTNAKHNDEAVTEYQCFLHPFTLALLNKRAANCNPAIENELDAQHLIRLLLKQFNNGTYLSNITLKQFAESSVIYCNTFRDSKLSQALCSVMTAQTHTSPLPFSNYHRLIQTRVAPIKVTTIDNFESDIKPTCRKKQTHADELSSFYEELTSCLSSNINRRKNDGRLKQVLIEFRDSKPWSTHKVVFVDWLISKSKTCGASTFKRYVAAIGKGWLLLNSNIDIFNSDRQTIEDAYLELFESIDNDTDIKSSKFNELHNFVAHQFGIPTMPSYVFPKDDSRPHVRSGFIDEALFLALLNSFDDFQELSSRDKLSLKSICLLMYRAALRPSEIRKLQFKHLEESNDGWAQIRDNKIGNNKTASALRKIPLYRLILGKEYELLEKYLSQKIAALGENYRNEPVFTVVLEREAFDISFVSRLITQLLRKLSKLEHLVTYHLRHSCLSRMQFILECPDELTDFPNISIYTAEQIKDIRQLLFYQTKVYGYHALANFAGHRSPLTTFNTYLHFSDLITAIQSNKKHIPLTLKQAMLCGISSRRAFKAEEDQVIKSFIDRILKKSTTLPLKPIVRNGLEPTELINQNDRRVNIEVCRRIIEQYSIGIDVELLANKHFIEQDTINKWINNALAIKSLTTSNTVNKRLYNLDELPLRLFSTARSESLAPSKLRHKEEHKLADRFINKFRLLPKDRRKEVQQELIRALKNTTINHSGIRFNSPTELKTFTNTMHFAFNRYQWRVIKYYHQSSLIKTEWDKATRGFTAINEKISSRKGRSSNGTVLLQLKSPIENDIVDNSSSFKKYSSHLLTYLASMVSIMMEDDLWSTLGLSSKFTIA